MRRRTLISLLIIGALVIIATGYVAYNGLLRGAITNKNRHHARSLVLVCRLYAEDHDGAWPAALSDLSPEYLEASNLDQFRFISYPGGERLEWIYAPTNARNDMAPVLSSPEAIGSKLILVYPDGYVDVTEPES